jgi:hypothetical protein
VRRRDERELLAYYLKRLREGGVADAPTRRRLRTRGCSTDRRPRGSSQKGARSPPPAQRAQHMGDQQIVIAPTPVTDVDPYLDEFGA